jgi:hypothetical protein
MVVLLFVMVIKNPVPPSVAGPGRGVSESRYFAAVRAKPAFAGLDIQAAFRGPEHIGMFGRVTGLLGAGRQANRFSIGKGLFDKGQPFAGNGQSG